jgi:uncharacterized membrane protein YesL
MEAALIGWLYLLAVGLIAYDLVWLRGLATFFRGGMSFIG